MKQAVIIVGQGEMAGVFARGFLRSGYPVYPALRTTNLDELAAEVPDPALVLVAVGEKDLQAVLEKLPAPWAEQTALLQNELLPRDWQPHGLNPTVISVWFEKKKGMDAKVLVPSPVYGSRSTLIAKALGALDIPVTVLDSPEALLFELVRKNVYIVTTNVAGLRCGGTVDELRRQHADLFRDVAGEVLQIQEQLTGTEFEPEPLMASVLLAFDGDPDHQCKGRSAPARLQRALQQADEFGLAAPTLRDIQAGSNA